MTEMTAAQIRDSIVRRDVSAREITEQALARIEAVDHELHSFLRVDGDHALEQVALLEERTRSGETPGPLWGVPFSVKDTYDTAGVTTTYGSRVFARHVPDKDAELVRRIRRAGGILVGKTNTPEFAIYIRTINDLQPETVNPWDRTRTTGGSSGGAAASVAAGLTTIAVGSDGGGSIRIPAALCGVVGLLPSRGALPRGGGHIGTRRFSSGGPIARDAADARILWQVMSGSHPATGPSDGAQQGARRDSDPAFRMRWIGDSGVPGAESDVISEVLSAAKSLATLLGADLHEPGNGMDSPRFSRAFYDMMQSDRLSTGGQELLDDREKNALLTAYGRHQFEQGSKIKGAAYSAALDVQLAATEHLERMLAGVDVLLTPTLAFIAPVIPTGTQALPEDARRGFVAFTFLMNFTGFPAVTVPCGMVRGMPIGLQLIARPGSEELLMEMAGQFQANVYQMPAAANHLHPG